MHTDDGMDEIITQHAIFKIMDNNIIPCICGGYRKIIQNKTPELLETECILVPRKMWVYDPQSGGKSIPNAMQPKIRQRILDHAEKHYSDRYNRIDIRFRGKFCYIDAYSEPFVPPDYNSELFDGKSREERIAQLRNVPTHLCRLRYFGDEENWTMAFYTYSHMKYEPCIFDNGSWHGTPEEAFDTSAVYLMK